MKTIFHGVVSSPFVIVATTKTGILSRTMIFFLIPYQVVFVGKPIQSMSKVEMGGKIGNSSQTQRNMVLQKMFMKLSLKVNNFSWSWTGRCRSSAKNYTLRAWILSFQFNLRSQGFRRHFRRMLQRLFCCEAPQNVCVDYETSSHFPSARGWSRSCLNLSFKQV